MKSFGLFVALFLVCSMNATCQEWANKLVTSTSDPKDVVKLLQSSFDKAVGTAAPSFTFRSLDDVEVHSLIEYKGHLTVVNFWGTKCSGCRLEMPALSRIHETYKSKGVLVLFLSSESKQTLNDYFASRPLSGVKGIIARNQLQEPYQMLAMPSSFLVDTAGVVRDAWIGPLTYEQLENKITAYLMPLK